MIHNDKTEEARNKLARAKNLVVRSAAALSEAMNGEDVEVINEALAEMRVMLIVEARAQAEFEAVVLGKPTEATYAIAA
jgi:hypothetical protein